MEPDRRVFVPARPEPPPLYPEMDAEEGRERRVEPPPRSPAAPPEALAPPRPPYPVAPFPEPEPEEAPAAMLHAAREMETQGDPAGAEQLYRRVLAGGGPAAEAARTELASLLSRQGYHAQVLPLLSPLGPAAPPEQWMLRAEAHEMVGRPAEAVWDYSDAARRSDLHRAEELRARIRHLLDRLSPWQLQEVAARCPFCPEGGYARLRLARLDLDAGRIDRAEEMLRDLSADFAGDVLGRAAVRHLHELQARRAIEPGLYGVLLPLSGPLQPFGERALRGILLGSHLLPGKDAPPLRLRVHDTRGDPLEAARGVEQLAREGVVGIIGPLKGSVAKHAAGTARGLGVPLLTMTPASDLSGEGVFRLYLREEDEVSQLVEFAMEERNLSRFAILYPDQPSGRRYRDLFWDAVVARGGEITGVEAFSPGGADGSDPASAIRRLSGVYRLSRTEIRERFVAQERQRLRRERELLQALGIFGDAPAPPGSAGGPATDTPPDSAEPISIDPTRLAQFEPKPIVDFDAVFLPAPNLTAAQVAPLLPFHDVEGVTLLGIRSWNYPTLVEVGEEYVDGALFPDAFHPAAPGAETFFETYQQIYGEEPGVIDAYAYDAISLIVSSTAGPVSETRPELERRLRGIWAASGATGPLTSHPDGDIAAQPKILTVDRGRFRLVR